MAEITSSDFKKLIEAQQETTRQMMSVEDRAADDAKKAEQTRIRSAAAIKGHETRLANQSQNTEIEATQESQETAEDSQESEEKSVGFLGKIANFMGLEKLRGSAEAEDSDKEESRSKQMLGYLKSTAGFLGGIAKQGMEKVKSGLSGFKKFAFGALAVAALAFLQSPMFEDIKKTILDVVIPAVAYLYDNVIKPLALYIGGKLKNLFLDLKAYVDGEKGIGAVIFDNIGIIAAIVTALAPNLVFGALKLAVTGLVKGIVLLAKGGVFAKIAAGFAVVKGFFMTTLLPFLTTAGATLASVLIPIALIANALYALKQGFDDFMFELEATGSVWEAVKSGIVGVISNLFGFPLNLIKSGVSFILEKIGKLFGIESFVNASKIMDEFDFIETIKNGLSFIGNAFAGLIDKIKNIAQNMIRKIPVFGDKLADKIFGTKAEQETAKKEAEEEQKRFEAQREALKEQKKLEKEAEEARKVEAEKKKQAALQVSRAPAAAKTEAISRRADPRQFGGGPQMAVNAPTNVNAPSTTNVSSSASSLTNNDRVIGQLGIVL